MANSKFSSIPHHTRDTWLNVSNHERDTLRLLQLKDEKRSKK